LFLFFRRVSSEEDVPKSKDSKRYKPKNKKKQAHRRNERNQEEHEVSSESKISHKNNVPNNKKGHKKDNKTTEDLSGYTPSEEDEVKTILDFIKGKDSEDLMRREKISATKAKTKKIDPKEEVVIEDFIADEESGEEFLLIKRKKIAAANSKKKEGEKEKSKKSHQKPFFKPSVVRQLKDERKPKDQEGEEKSEKRGKKGERRSAEVEPEDQTDQKEEKKVQRRTRQEENREDTNRRRPRREFHEQGGEENNERKRRPPSPPTLENYNPPSVEDIMASMTSYYERTKPEKKFKAQPLNPKAKFELKPPKEKKVQKESKGAQKPSRLQRKGFDSLKKKLQISILQYLDPSDLAAFSYGCKSFAKMALAEPVWKYLCQRDFGLTEKTQDKWKLTYKAHFLKNKN